MTDPLAPEVEPLVLAVLAKRVKERDALARAAIAHLYPDGVSHVIRSPLDGARLGTVARTDPDPVWKVVDMDALVAHLAQDPDNFEHVDDIAGSQEQVLEVLAEHAPHLLARVERIRPDVIKAAVEDAAQGGTPLPGIGPVKPGGVLRVTPDKTAAAAVERLVQAGVITWDGRPALPEGEGAA